MYAARSASALNQVRHVVRTENIACPVTNVVLLEDAPPTMQNVAGTASTAKLVTSASSTMVFMAAVRIRNAPHMSQAGAQLL
jgi:hypothetical protein